ncbi:formylmethanofuran dehydrogenase subunit A [Lignipirellula cremea]|uniref:Formyltransferase/hydrolase complex Fhc subunit A n=1 Tax=Lignipirellula cremea TaxID=2528010 RepID=A0A518DTM7_9BACT|nr:formylmethanofuran dehydrogenase subunit A [Lignipirellula cremea]QDU95196.1 Formyltransferase/hydrolase complex Fhc subunit A [Lignipirellula cremea]
MLRITGGKVYDPANGINGEVRDICIVDGKVVASMEGGRELDAAGMIVFPGGVDVHTHVAGGSINFARAMTPEDHRRTTAFIRTQSRRAGLGGMAPTTFATGYLYAGMGWTTVNEAAVPILSARHTHEELADVPIVDKSCLVLLANNEILLDLLEEGEMERAKHVVAWQIWAAKAYGVKAVNPGGVASWKWGDDSKQLTDPISGYNTLTPATIVSGLAQIIDELGLPHPLHLHCNNLGAPGNISTTLETMRSLEGRRAHMAHLQYHAYGGDDWSNIRSETKQLAEYFNAHPNFTCDAGAVLFGDTVTITADGPWQHLLYKLTGRKWGNVDVENETGCGIVPYTYRPSNLVNAVQWAAGLELMLLIEDPWRVFLTTDHPNGACFWRYPEIIQLLMCADFRRECISQITPSALKNIYLPELDREYTLYEIATVMSAGPARALGLKEKGQLGVGADADLVIYNEDKDIARMFGHPRYVIKGGEIVIAEGDILATPQGRESILRPQYDETIEAFIKPRFEDVYTMSFENYPVELDRIEEPHLRDCLEVE